MTASMPPPVGDPMHEGTTETVAPHPGPMPRAMVSPPASALPRPVVESTRGAALVALGFAALATGADVVGAVLAFPMTREVQAGLAGVGSSAFSNAYLVTEAVNSLGLFAAWVATAVWLTAARRNAEAITTLRHQRSAVWAWLGWVVPVVSLWFPYQVVRDIHRGSSAGLQSPRHLGAWWGLWLATLFTSNVSVRLAQDSGTIGLLGPSRAIGAVLTIGALLLWVQIVLSTVALQEQHRQRG